MLNKKAQALVEFVLLLPIIVLLLFSFIDILHLLVVRNETNDKFSDEIELVEDKKETVIEMEKHLKKEDISLSYETDDKYITIRATKKIKWISPVTDIVLKDRNTIKLKRVIPIE